MSAKDELKNSLGNEKEKVKGFLTYSVKVANLTPDAQRRLKEIEAVEAVIDSLPDDVAEELAGTVLPFQRNEERKASLYYPQPSELSNEAIDYIQNRSGTATVFMGFLNNFTRYEPDEYKHSSVGGYGWIQPVKGIFADMANDVDRRNRIHTRLTKLNPELGQSFKIAEDTYEKARGGPNLVYQGVMGMRNVLQGFWGELAALARTRNPGKTKKFSGLHYRNERHRKVVAECLTSTNEDGKTLLYRIEKLRDLYKDMSDSKIGKNNLADDIPRMESLHTSWIILLSDLVGFI